MGRRRHVPGGACGKESTCYCKRCRLDPWVGKIPWNRKSYPTPVFLPGKSHEQRSLVGYIPWGCKESDKTEVTEDAHTHMGCRKQKNAPEESFSVTVTLCLPADKLSPQGICLYINMNVEMDGLNLRSLLAKFRVIFNWISFYLEMLDSSIFVWIDSLRTELTAPWIKAEVTVTFGHEFRIAQIYSFLSL